MTSTASSQRTRPLGPPPVTKNPLSLLAYSRRMGGDPAARIGERFEYARDCADVSMRRRGGNLCPC